MSWWHVNFNVIQMLVTISITLAEISRAHDAIEYYGIDRNTNWMIGKIVIEVTETVTVRDQAEEWGEQRWKKENELYYRHRHNHKHSQYYTHVYIMHSRTPLFVYKSRKAKSISYFHFFRLMQNFDRTKNEPFNCRNGGRNDGVANARSERRNAESFVGTVWHSRKKKKKKNFVDGLSCARCINAM